MKQAGDHLGRRAWLGGDGIQPSDDRFLFAAVLIAFTQAHLGLGGRGAHHGHAFAIGLDDQEGGFAGEWRGRLLRIEGFDIARILGHQITDGLGGQFQAQNAGEAVRHLGVGAAHAEVLDQVPH